MRVIYLVHDLGDAAVDRRTKMLEAGGADVQVFGFTRRGSGVQSAIQGAANSLGFTANGRLFSRIGAVLLALLKGARLRRSLASADLILARNLEMLLIALCLRPKSSTVRVVYECLDIHRVMLGRSIPSVLLRRLEKNLLRECSLLISSSPAFIREYFAGRQHYSGRVLIVENKMVELESHADHSGYQRIENSPFRIGWFGVIRCRMSLQLLTSLAKALNGRAEIIIAGKPAYDQIPEFDEAVRGLPWIKFLGAYEASQLGSLYRQVHFNWTIDYFEAGMNSSWLLPNRIYEGGAFEAVPVAMAGVETSAWLQRRGIGIILENPRLDLLPCFERMDHEAYSRLKLAMQRVPRSQFVAYRADCRDLVCKLAEVPVGTQ